MVKYRVLRGSHQIMTNEIPEGGGVPHVSVETYRAGDVFEVPGGKDYDNRMRHVRFKRLLRVPDDTPVSISPLPEPPEDDLPEDSLPDAPEHRVEGLLANQLLDATQGMTIPDLKELAADNGIDLGGLTKKDDILRCLQNHSQA